MQATEFVSRVSARMGIREPSQDNEIFADLPFSAFCECWLRVQDKDGKIVPLVLNRAQCDLAERLSNNNRVLVLKARQLGISTVIQAWHYYQVCRGGARTNTLCHDDELTSELRNMVMRFQDEIDEIYRPKRKYDNAKVTTYPDLNSQTRIATVGGHSSRLSAGKKKGRGGSNTHIHGTEVAFWPDADGVMSAAMQAGNPRIVLESTPNGMVGWFYERAIEALDETGIWTLAFYEWWWDDEYRISIEPGEVLTYIKDEQALVDKYDLAPEQIKWRRQKQAELPHTFEQEYPEDPRTCFLASGISYFRNVEHCFIAPMDVQPKKGKRYVAGLDFAQTNDFLVLIVIDTDVPCMVDMLRMNNAAWQDMRTAVAKRVHKWNAIVHGEANAMGKTNIELLQSGEYDRQGDKLYDGIQLMPFDTTSVSKPPLIQGLYHALHEAGLQLQVYSALRHELRAFISKQTSAGHWQYEAGGGAHDDTVIALALAWHGIAHQQVSATFSF